MTIFTTFLRDESGAVTIDWVALTAGILLLGMAVVYGIFNEGVTPVYDAINTSLAAGAPSQATIGDVPTFNDGGTTTTGG